MTSYLYNILNHNNDNNSNNNNKKKLKYNHVDETWVLTLSKSSNKNTCIN